MRFSKELSTIKVKETSELADRIGEMQAHPLEVSEIPVQLPLIKALSLAAKILWGLSIL
jgi:hypothetical protein